MADYEELFYKMFNAVSKATEKLEKAQEEILEDFIASKHTREEMSRLFENIQYKTPHFFKE